MEFNFQKNANKKVSKLKFATATTANMRTELIYPRVINGHSEPQYLNHDDDQALKSVNHADNLETFVTDHEPIRNYLSGKKLKGQKLTKAESLVLHNLNEKLDKLLNSPITGFHKKTRELIAEADRLIFLLGR